MSRNGIYKCDIEITKWIEGKGEYFVKNEGPNDVSNKVYSRYEWLVKQYRILISQFSLCIYLLKDIKERSNNPNMYYSTIGNVYRIMTSLKQSTNFFLAAMHTLSESPIKHKTLLNYFNNDFKKAKERVNRLTETILPEYYEAAGLETYINFLEESGVTFKQKIEAFYIPRIKSITDEVAMDKEIKQDMYTILHKAFIAKIKLEMQEFGIEYVDVTDKLTKYQQKVEEIKNKKKQEQIDERRNLAKDDIDHYLTFASSILHKDFDKGSALKRDGKVISDRAVKNISNEASIFPNKEFTLIIGAKFFNNRTTLVFYNNNGELTRFPVSSNVRLFKNDESDEVNTILDKLNKENVDDNRRFFRFEALTFKLSDVEFKDEDKVFTEQQFNTSLADTILLNKKYLEAIDDSMERFSKKFINALSEAIENKYTWNEFRYRSIISSDAINSLIGTITENVTDEHTTAIIPLFFKTATLLNSNGSIMFSDLIFENDGSIRYSTYIDKKKRQFISAVYLYKAQSHYIYKDINGSSISYIYDDSRENFLGNCINKSIKDNYTVEKYLEAMKQEEYDNRNFKKYNSSLIRLLYKPLTYSLKDGLKLMK